MDIRKTLQNLHLNLKGTFGTNPPAKPMNKIEMLRRLGIPPTIYTAIMEGRIRVVTLEKNVDSTSKSNKGQAIVNSLDDYFAQVRVSFNKNKKIDQHLFKHVPYDIHIKNVIASVERGELITAGRNLYYAFYVFKNRRKQEEPQGADTFEMID